MGRNVPCQIDLESDGKPITYEVLNARLLDRAELSEAILSKLLCEDHSMMYVCDSLDGISRPRTILYPVKVA